MSDAQSTGAVVAVDLGATSGRVIIGHVGNGLLRLEHVTRFANIPITSTEENGTGLHWDIRALRRDVLDGLASAGTAMAAARQRIASVGIDSWAVDYALMRSGKMLGTPFHYRDERTAAGVEAVHAVVPFPQLYTQNGLQFLPFNTLYQLAADRVSEMVQEADTILLIPDLFAFWLTGKTVAEATNASTTGLLSRSFAAEPAAGDATTLSGTRHAADTMPRWNDELLARLALPRSLFPPLVAPGAMIGPLSPAVAREIGFEANVTAVGSHDTASAVVGTPMTNPDSAYISCGTWGLVGVELEHPVLTRESREAGFTNEGGVDGRIRFLHNVMGLWLLSESMRVWEHAGLPLELSRLLAEAADVSGPIPLFDVDDPRLLAPGDIPGRIADWLGEHGQPVPHTPAMFARSIVESLAETFARAVHTAAELSGRRVEAIHLVGGGSQNELLCQLTADRSGLPVLAGPVEATAIGNVLVQARTVGLIDGDLESLRALVARAYPPCPFQPRPEQTC